MSEIHVDAQKLQEFEHMKVIASRKVMDPSSSLGMYPRPDTTYKTKHSLAFDIMQTEIFRNRGEPASVGILRWVCYFIIGVAVGLTAFLMELIEENLVDSRDKIIEKVLFHSNNDQFLAWGFLALWSFGLAVVASFLTIYVGPGATGSGMAEIIAVLNGVNYPQFIGWGTLFVKTFCVVLGIGASLCIGKEGPLAHIGSCISQIVIHYVPIGHFDYFKNDVSKREFLAGGVSAGVSAAFGSPIGGSLFSYELSKPTTFWTFSMIWRIFFCSSVATYTLALANQLRNGDPLTLSAGGTIKFGSLSDTEMRLGDIHSAFALGILGGFLGAMFVNVNTFLTRLRKKYSTTTMRKILETGFFAVATMSVSAFFIILYKDDCQLEGKNKGLEGIKYNSWTCPEGYFNPMATLYFNTEGGTIRALFAEDYYQIRELYLFIFGATWYFFTITTYGVWVPAGLFLPGIIMGGALGRLYTQTLINFGAYDGTDLKVL